MLEQYVPDKYYKSIFAIDYKKLKKNGIKCLLIDLDNTIAPPSIKKPTKKVIDLFEELKDMGFKLIIFANCQRSRVEVFKSALGVDASALTFKPKKEKYLKVMDVYRYKPEEICAIGDQLVTDIYGANRLDITTILVNPVSSKDSLYGSVNRKLEKAIIKKLAKNEVFVRGKYYE